MGVCYTRSGREYPWTGSNPDPRDLRGEVSSNPKRKPEDDGMRMDLKMMVRKRVTDIQNTNYILYQKKENDNDKESRKELRSEVL
jgi:hypothetical protein